jgi:hypothetical protein
MDGRHEGGHDDVDYLSAPFSAAAAAFIASGACGNTLCI